MCRTFCYLRSRGAFRWRNCHCPELQSCACSEHSGSRHGAHEATALEFEQPVFQQLFAQSVDRDRQAPGTAPMQSHGTAAALAPGKGPSYENRWDAYGGLAFMNGQAGQNLPKRFNMGGGEGQFTYWIPGHLDNRLGLSADVRYGAGTTPVLPNPTYNRPLVVETIYAGGAQWRGPRNRYVAINYHGFFGAVYGNFDRTIKAYPFGPSPIAACPDPTGLQGNIGTLLQPRGSMGRHRRQHRLQPGTEVCDPPCARLDLRAPRDGNPRVLRHLARSALPRRTLVDHGSLVVAGLAFFNQ